MLLWLAASCLAEDALPLVAVVPAVVLALPFAMHLVERSPSAVTNAFGAQSAYKGELHRAIRWGTFALSVLVLAVGLGGWK